MKSEVIYRPAQPQDIPNMADLFRATLKNLYQRNNLGFETPSQQAMIKGYSHVLNTGIFFLAELEGKIEGISGAIVRDNQWFLSAFWVNPELQKRKIGKLLLEKVYKKGKKLGATTFFTWSSIDHTAIATYMKLGLYPGYPIFTFEGRITKVLPEDNSIIVEDIQEKISTNLDLNYLGYSRNQDHQYFNNSEDVKGFQLEKNGDMLGYFYISKNRIGPAIWTTPELTELVIKQAVKKIEKFSSEIDLLISVPGINHSAIKFLLEQGFRIISYSHLLRNMPFGKLEQYIPSGPLLF